MKITKLALRIWFSVATLFSFLVGWIFFAHSNKPAPLPQSQPAQSAPVPDLTSRQLRRSFRSNGSTFSNPSFAPSFRPRLRTGGS